MYIYNLKGYGCHLFVSSSFKYGYKHDSSDNTSCIPNNDVRYISFSKKIEVGEYILKEIWKTKSIMYEIWFLDTFASMASSFESLPKNLRPSNDINELRKILKITSDEFKKDKQFLQWFKREYIPMII